MNIGTRIKEARLRLGLTQGQLAERLGCDQSTVAHWERGKSQPRITDLPNLSRELGVTVNWLLFGEEENKTRPVVPVVGYIDAHSKVWRYPPDCEQQVLAPPLDVQPVAGERLEAIEVRGDVLYPHYRGGDLIFYVYREGQTSIQPFLGLECVVAAPSGDLYFGIVTPGNRANTATVTPLRHQPNLNVEVEWCAPVAWVRKADHAA